MTGLSSELPWARYRFVKDVAPLDPSHGIHLHNLAIAELLFDARNAVHLPVLVDTPGTIDLPNVVVARF